MIVYLNGNYVDESAAHLSVWDSGFLNGHAVYETMRTYHGSIRLFDQHFKRLQASAAGLGISFPFTFAQLSSDLQTLIHKRLEEDTSQDFRIRITLSAGSKDIRTADSATPTLLMTAQVLSAPKIDTISMQSYQMTRQLPHIKSTAVLAAIAGQMYAREHGADEALLVDNEGIVHEGSFSNVYLVKNGVLKYPKTGALAGVTQALITDLAKDIPQEATDLTIDDFYQADEVFTTGSVRGVLPVKNIDGHPFVVPGDITIKIQERYQTWINT